ncbi:MAG TPA: TMEM43 family protein [Rhodanobacteraceae bacterium]|nr:TMEM43 family protein [Rhodanobacteraceae bacterium]
MAKKPTPATPASTNRSKPIVPLVAIVVVAIAIAAYAWLHRSGSSAPTKSETPPPGPSFTASGAAIVPSDRIDPANEGRLIQIKGDLVVKTPATDPQLGITANALMLLRFVEMLQWQEQCSGTGKQAKCTYQQVWSPQTIKSADFREKKGHENPERLPFGIARFPAEDVRLGAFRVDGRQIGNYRLGPALKLKAEPYAVRNTQLPSNLEVSFRESNGTLYAGDPAKPAVGDVRVVYRIVPTARVEATGIQHEDRIIVRNPAAAATAPAGSP